MFAWNLSGGRMNSLGALQTAVVIALAAVAGTGGAQEPLRQAPLPAFDATQLTPDRYTVIKRLWVDSWRTVFDVPTHAESSAALAQLSDDAAELRGRAVTNVLCLNDQRSCYGGY